MTAPSYYPDFQCLAGACRDNCCRTGWEIQIDGETMDYYRSLPQPRRDMILAGIGKDEEGVDCILPRDGQCPFLTGEGLCSLVLELGEEHIGDICALHPRYREWFPGRMEIGVGLCCEEAARLILSDPEPAEFDTYLTDGDPDDDEEEELPLYLPLLELRDRMFALAQDRGLPLAERMARLLRLARAAQEEINHGAVPDPALPPSPIATQPGEGFLPALVALHREMEYLEPGWPRALEALEGRLAGLDRAGFRAELAGRAYEYEHLLVYLLFRYLMKAVYDENLLGRVWQAVAMVLAIAALGCSRWQETGRFSLADQIEVARQYSKEVEYSDDNMEALLEGFLFTPELGLPSLLGLLEG